MPNISNSIQIIDYGMGNLRSVQKAFERIGVEADICQNPSELSNASRVVLPGVGGFRDAIQALRGHGFVNAIEDFIATKKPFLGICLGLQLLFDVSYEDGQWEGLGIFPGQVVRFDEHAELKIPHIGWNTLHTKTDCPLFSQIPQDSFFYFVHSYYAIPKDNKLTSGVCDYGCDFTASVTKGNIFATQFHPEKSQRWGLQLLKNFATMGGTP